jgi:pimeloyl-ACP methyl ester carboxylesterase
MKIVKIFAILLTLLCMVLHKAVLASPAVKHEVIADGHAIVVWEKSVKEAKGLILLHHGRTWSSLPDFDLQLEGEELSLMDGFNRQGYSVWAMDARGYGETTRDASGWNTPNRAAKDISIVLQWLADKSHTKINLWGWSMGSMLSQLAAQQYPENIKSLILFGYPLALGFAIPSDIQNTEAPKFPTTEEAAASDFIVPGSISQNAIDEYGRHALQADPIRADWHYQHQYNALDASKLRMPVLLLQGEFDPLTDTAMHAQIFSKLPNANKQWVVLKDGDHAALLEIPRIKLIYATTNFIEWLDM